MKNGVAKIALVGCSVLLVAGLVIGAVVVWFLYGAIDSVNRSMTRGYVVDGGKVMFNTGWSGFGAPQSNPVAEADAASFKDIGGGYATDRSNAYLDGLIIPQSDGPNFAVITGSYAADKNHVFYNRTILSDSPSSFKFIKPEKESPRNDKFPFATDGKNVYYGEKTVYPGEIDADSFRLLGYGDYFKDKNRVYTLNKIIEGADPATFTIVPDFVGYYTKDKNSVFYQGDKVPDCDPATDEPLDNTTHRDARHVFTGVNKFSDDPRNFKILEKDYSKDSKNVYWKTVRLGADAATFMVFNTEDTITYAKDAKSVYWCGIKVDKADPGTFSGLGAGYGKDKNTVWYGQYAEEPPKIIGNADAVSFEVVKPGDFDARDKNNNYRFGEVKGAR